MNTFGRGGGLQRNAGGNHFPNSFGWGPQVPKPLLRRVVAFLSGVSSIELLPERYLKPQDFNHHPFTDVGIPASLKNVLKSANPYAILSKKRPKEGREFPPQNLVIYPTPHPSVASRKYIETNEIGKYEDPYVSVPKNYAFSYIVKDQHSGDDFSHSQAHNGKATRGQYRVKLPDGRTQIVNYTADHKGYRADVQYEEELISKPSYHTLHEVPETSGEVTQILQSGHQNYRAGSVSNQIPSVSKVAPQIVYTVTATPSNYLPSSTTAAPVQYVPDQTPVNLVVKSTSSPHYEPHYATTTAVPYVQQQFVTSTETPHYIPQQHVPSTPIYPIESASANAASPAYHQQQYQNYQAISSTVSPEQAVIVTPRPFYKPALRKNEPQQSALLYYRFL